MRHLRDLIPRYFLMPLLGISLVGCSARIWQRQEAAKWYQEQCIPARPYCGPMWYAGTDEQFHFFAVRSMDTWVVWRTPKESIMLDDVQPREQTHLYYAVDPALGFRRIQGLEPPF